MNLQQQGELTSNLTIGWGLKQIIFRSKSKIRLLTSNLTIGWGLKRPRSSSEIWDVITYIQSNNWMRIETTPGRFAVKLHELSSNQNWMRIETSLKVEGTLIAYFINQCKIDCGLKSIHRFTFSGSVSFIQYINWMWIETLAVLTEMSLLLFTFNITIGWGLKPNDGFERST